MSWFSNLFGGGSKKQSGYSTVSRPVKGVGSVVGLQHTGVLHEESGTVLDMQKSRSGRSKIRTVPLSEFAGNQAIERIPLPSTNNDAITTRWNEVVNAENDRSIRQVPYCAMNENGLNCQGVSNYVAHGVPRSHQADAAREAGLSDLGRFLSSSSQGSSSSFSSFEDD